MREYLIKRGANHILANIETDEAFSFSVYGEEIGKVDVKSSILLGGSALTDIRIVSFLGKGRDVDVYFDGKRVLISGSTVLEVQSRVRDLPRASVIPYRVAHEENVTQILYALKSTVTREEVSRAIRVSSDSWESI